MQSKDYGARSLQGSPGGPVFEQAAAADDIVARMRLARAVEMQDGRTVAEICFREPTMRDALDCGEIMKPVTREFKAGGMPGSLGVESDPIAIEKWFCRLTGLPSSMFVKISARDSKKIIGAIQNLTGDLDAGNLNTSQPIFGSAAG